MANTMAFRTNRLFVTGTTARGLAFIAQCRAAKDDLDPLPDGADCLAETILSEWLDQQPLLKERQWRVRKAIAEIDRELLKP